MPDYAEVRKASIIPRGDAGAVTFFQLATEDDGMYTQEYLLSQIKVALGGHAAEEIVYGRNRVSTGATNDFSQVYSIVRQMITRCGFSDTIGKLNIDENMMSTPTSYIVETEMKTIVDECYAEVIKLLKSNKYKLEQIKDMLLEDEIIDGSAVYEIVNSCNVKK